MSFETSFGYEIAIVGATGCIGREIVQELGNFVPVRQLHLYASLASTAERIDVDGETYVVNGIDDAGIPSEVRSVLHVVILCCPPEVALKIGAELSEDGIAIIDVTGAWASHIGFSLAGLAEREDDFQSHRMASLPSPTAAILARFWQSVHTFQPIQMSSVVSISASRFGQRGIDELAKQVRGLLNFQDAPQAIFPDGLAFDVLPSLVGLQSSELSESKVGEALADLTLLEPHRFRNRIQVAPIFSGISMHVSLSMAGSPNREELCAVLNESSWLDVQDVLPNLRSTIGHPKILAGRIELNPWVQGFEVQLCADNVALTVHNALSLLQHFHVQELL